MLSPWRSTSAGRWNSGARHMNAASLKVFFDRSGLRRCSIRRDDSRVFANRRMRNRTAW